MCPWRITVWPARPLRIARALAPALVWAASGCSGEPAETPPAPGAQDGGAAAAAPLTASAPPRLAPGASAARRPTRRYYLGRTRERCEVYSVDGDAISTHEQVPCPPDLQMGERLRLAGQTCVRESPVDPAREVPVVCPDPLTNQERYDRETRDAGSG